MFSPEFEQVYREAFASATGRDFSNEEVQADYQSEGQQVVEALLDRWTDPDFDPSPVTDFKAVRRSQTFRIKHPDTKNFTEEDAADIAHIRFFGGQVLKAARHALHENVNIDPYDPDKFDSDLWLEAHADTDFDPSFAYNSDTPSPQRLREWPKGEYMNCLGIAIAAAAESENLGTEYVFMNRLRTAAYESANDTIQFLRRIEKLSPKAFLLEGIIHELEVALMEGAGESEDVINSRRRCMLDEEILDYIFRQSESLDTSFHHSVIRKNDPELDRLTRWSQYDPFGRVYAEIGPKALDDALTYDELLGDTGACSEILLLDGDAQEYTSMSLSNLIDIAVRSRNRLEKLCNGPLSLKLMEDIRLEMEKSRQAILFDLLPAEERINNLSDEYIFDKNAQLDSQVGRLMWVNILGRVVSHDEAAFNAYHETLRNHMEKTRVAKSAAELPIKDTGEVLSDSVYSSMRNSHRLQEEFKSTILAMPFTYAIHAAESRVKKSVFRGGCEKTMEVGDAAFQIGSMYLNHYARWREDGIVNVAKELARVNPSQLVWQSAVSQEVESSQLDDRVAAVGALVRSLKRRQKHPLVNITQ